jgi:allantoin racemase
MRGQEQIVPSNGRRDAATAKITYIHYDAPSERDEVPASLLAPGVEIEYVFPDGYVAPLSGSPADHLIANLATVAAAKRAERQGSDCIVIGTVGDYGIEEVRSVVDIPVVGAGQASFLTAASLGGRFGIVTVWPQSSGYLYRNSLRLSGLEGLCVSVRHVTADSELATLSADDNFFLRMRSGKEEMLERIGTELRAATEQDGADVIVLGCCCMSPVADRLAELVDVPIVDPTSTGYKFAEAMMSLGLAQSRKAYPSPAANRTGYFADVGETGSLAIARDDPEAIGCEVCAIAASGQPSP